MKEFYQFYSRALLCLALSVIVPHLGISQVQTPRHVTTSSSSNGFYEYLPAGYESGSKTYPLMIFIHGTGELGDGGADLPKVLVNGPPKLLNDQAHPFPTSFTVNGNTYSFIILSPQFIYWPPSADIDAFITYAIQHYRVDASRIYLTGLSLGGGVTWFYASMNSTYANKLAAILPVSGSAIDAPSAQIIASANLPVFATHNEDDPTVPSSNTINNIALINSSSPPPTPRAIDTIFPVSGHDSWTTTYNPAFTHRGLNVYQWMLQYSRGISVPLPVTLTDYSASLSDDKTQVNIDWTTLSEQNNQYFILQRAGDGKQFANLDTITPTGQPGGGSSYVYTDRSPLPGNNFYRLSQVDKDGKTTFYGILQMTIPVHSTSSLRISPNPASGVVYLDLVNPEQGMLQVNLLDVQGRTLRTLGFRKQSLDWHQSIDLSGIPPGSYFIRIRGNTIREVQPFIKK